MTNILIIDSNAAIGFRIKKIFEEYPIHLSSVSSEQDIVNKIHRHYDIIIIDVNMRNDDGFEIIQKINEINPGAMIVIVTSMNTRKAFVRGIRLGASDYILKPFSDEYIQNKLIKHVKEIEKNIHRSRINVEDVIYRHIEQSIKNNFSILVGLIVVYNKKNPTQIVSNVPLIHGMFSKFEWLLHEKNIPERSFEYTGETVQHATNAQVVILDKLELSDKEYVVSDFKKIANGCLQNSDFNYELEFISLPHEVNPNQKILSVLTERIEKNIE